MSLRFRTQNELIEYLKNTQTGQEIVDEVIQIPRINVLAVQRSDGVELYAPRRVHVTVVTRVHGSSVDATLLTEKLLDEALSPMLRELHEPGRLKAVVTPQRMTVQECEWWGAYQDNIDLLGSVKNDR